MAVPTYVYKFVKTGETLEIEQAFSDPTLTQAVHPATGRKMAVKKVFTPVGVTFRGDGFYKTDSRPSKKTGSSSSNGSSDTKAADAPKATEPAKSSAPASSSSGAAAD